MVITFRSYDASSFLVLITFNCLLSSANNYGRDAHEEVVIIANVRLKI